MARPKRKDKTEKLNLLVAIKAKRKAFRMATDRDTSIGKLFEALLEAEEARVKAEINGA